MTYRDTASSLAQRVTDNLVGTVLYRPSPWAKLPARWDVQIFPRPGALVSWYEDIAASPTLYYYIAVFDKSYRSSPVAEAIAPPQPDDLGYQVYDDARRGGYRWRPGAFAPGYRERTGVTVGAEAGSSKALDIAKAFGLFALVALPIGLLIEKSKMSKQTREEQAEFRRLGLDWNASKGRY